MNHVLEAISNSRGIKSVRIISVPWFAEKFCDPNSNSETFVPLQLTFLTLLSRLEDHSLRRLDYPRLNGDMMEYLSLHQKNTCNLKLRWSGSLSYMLFHLFPHFLGMSEKITELDVSTLGMFHLPHIDWSRLLKLRIKIRQKAPHSMSSINALFSRGLESLTHLTIDDFRFSRTPLKVLQCPNIRHFSVSFCAIYRSDFEMIFNNPRLKHLEISCCLPGMVLCILRPHQDLESLRVRVGLMSPKRSEALAASILSHKATLHLLILHNLSFKTSSNYAQFVDLATQCQKLSQLRLQLGEEDLLENCKARIGRVSIILAHYSTDDFWFQFLIESLPLLVTLKVDVVGPKDIVCQAECTEIATRTAHNVMKKLPASSKFTLLAFCFFNRTTTEGSPEINSPHWQRFNKYRCQYFVRRLRAPSDLRARASKGNKNAIRIDRNLARCIVSESDVIDYFCLHSKFWSESKVTKPWTFHCPELIAASRFRFADVVNGSRDGRYNQST